MHLRNACPPQANTSEDDVLPLDELNSENRLSNVYYMNVLSGRTVIPADQSLLEDQTTSYLVHMYASEWLN
ncbi:Peroxidase 66 [Bienertia sinuspersici]